MHVLSDRYVAECTTHLNETEYLLRCLLKMRVFSNYVNPRQFKQASLDLLTSSHKAVLKRRKLKADGAAELLVGRLSLKGLHLLCDLYDVSLQLVADRMYFQCGAAPDRCFSAGYEGELKDVGALFELVNVDKPLFAASYYSKAELFEVAERLHLDPTTKAQAHVDIMKKIASYIILLET